MGGFVFFLLDADGRRHLRLKNAGNYSWVGYSNLGETLVVVKQMTDQVRRRLNEHLTQVHAELAGFSGNCRDDLQAILRRFDRLCDLLTHQHDRAETEPQWEALDAQIGALLKTPEFSSRPSALTVHSALKQARSELEAFVNGQMTLSTPLGLLTQDGIDISPHFAHLPLRLQLGIGHMYNLDLCGEYRLSLNASRDRIVEDEKLAKLVMRLYSQIGPFLGDWFREESIPEEDVADYVKSVPQRLGELVRRAYQGGAASVARTEFNSGLMGPPA